MICDAVTTVVNLIIRCEKEAGHDGFHGAGAFTDYGTTWPHPFSSRTEAQQGDGANG